MLTILSKFWAIHIKTKTKCTFMGKIKSSSVRRTWVKNEKCTLKIPDLKSNNVIALPYGSSAENSTKVTKSRSLLCFSHCLGSYSSFLPGNSFTCIKNSYKSYLFSSWKNTVIKLPQVCTKTCCVTNLQASLASLTPHHLFSLVFSSVCISKSLIWLVLCECMISISSHLR